MLNTLREHDFQDAFKNGRSSGDGAYTQKGPTSRVIVASSPKVSLTAPVTEIMDARISLQMKQCVYNVSSECGRCYIGETQKYVLGGINIT
jgi:hypothetical protein